MRVTSAEANKLLKKLADDKYKIEREQDMYKTFTAATIENVDDLRPNYSFFETQEALDRIDSRMMAIKHALNVFNSSTEVGDSGLTIDQVLIKLPQLNRKANMLMRMRDVPEKKRDRVVGNIIDYVYANYNPQDAAKMYDETTAIISDLQLALDHINSTETFEI